MQVKAYAWLLLHSSHTFHLTYTLMHSHAYGFQLGLRVAAVYRVSSRDSGKTAVDAVLGEVMVTCEKIWWLVKHGQKWLKPEHRSAGIMVSITIYAAYARA